MTLYFEGYKALRTEDYGQGHFDVQNKMVVKELDHPLNRFRLKRPKSLLKAFKHRIVTTNNFIPPKIIFIAKRACCKE